MRPVARMLGASCVVSVLALVACAATARAQAPTPNPVSAPQPPDPAIAWDEAELTWPAPDEFSTGGSLASCENGPCGIMYLIEASVSGGPGWGPLALVDVNHYKATGLRPGVWSFRVKAAFKGSGYSPASPTVSKTITVPVSEAPGQPTAK